MNNFSKLFVIFTLWLVQLFSFIKKKQITSSSKYKIFVKQKRYKKLNLKIPRDIYLNFKEIFASIFKLYLRRFLKSLYLILKKLLPKGLRGICL